MENLKELTLKELLEKGKSQQTIVDDKYKTYKSIDEKYTKANIVKKTFYTKKVSDSLSDWLEASKQLNLIAIEIKHRMRDKNKKGLN